MELPNQVKSKIKSTDVALKGQTVSSSYKPAILENGLRVMVPPFVQIDEKIIINSEDLSYVKRVD